MEFKPKTQKEIEESRLWKKGEYPFEIVTAVEKSSKSSNEMIELKVKVFGADGIARIITDYLLEKRMEKLSQACAACGLTAEYKNGSVIGSNFLGKKGKLKLGVEKSKDGYPAKNVVLGYVAGVANDNEAGLEAILTRNLASK